MRRTPGDGRNERCSCVSGSIQQVFPKLNVTSGEASTIFELMDILLTAIRYETLDVKTTALNIRLTNVSVSHPLTKEHTVNTL